MDRKVLAEFGLVTLLAGAAPWVFSSRISIEKVPLTPGLFSRGEQLYGQNCAACHGATGDGQGTAASLLYPKPRDFTQGYFRLVSTNDQQPSNDDLFNSISRGMPGSAMPPWNHLSNEDRWSLVYYVRYLKEAGKELSAGTITDEQIAAGLPTEMKRKLASVDAAPESHLPVPAEPASTREGVERGKILFTQACASCHGPEGKGDGPQAMQDSAGLPVKPRDLTAGVFKGSSASEELWFRINAGLPGSPMPGYQGAYSDDKLWDLIHFVQSLPKPGVEEQAHLRRHQLKAPRVKEPLMEDPDAALWKNVTPVSVSLTPLWWRNDRIEDVEVQALHNGKQAALRLSWKDSTENNMTVTPQSFSDGGAIQFSTDPNPPFFAMGDKTAAVTFWHWKASAQRDLKERVDIQANYPHAAVDWYEAQRDYKRGSAFEVRDSSVATHDSTYITGWGAGNPLSDPKRSTAVEESRAKGFGTLTSNPAQKNPVLSKGVWKNGQWSVVFIRNLNVRDSDRLGFTPGQTIHVAFAVWDGNARDRNGQKMVSIWNELKLEK